MTSTLGHLLAEYLRSIKPDKERDPHRLYISDLGKCPRMIQYRILETPPDSKGESVRDNETIMFYLADALEEAMGEALKWEGSLLAYQLDIPIHDRENWGGRLDFITDHYVRQVLEFKTLNPNAFRYPIDYDTHRYQAWCYHHYCQAEWELKEYPLLAYFDRGSKANDPQEKLVTPQPIKALMDDLDFAREEALKFNDVTYERLPKVLQVRSSNKVIKLEPDSRCRAAYCDYFYQCNPDTSTETWADRPSDREKWNIKKKADPVVLEHFVQKMLDEIKMDDPLDFSDPADQ